MPARLRQVGLGALVLATALVSSCGTGAPRLDVGAAGLRLAGHQELDLESADAPSPLLLGTETPPAVCLSAAVEADTSRWEGRVAIDAGGGDDDEAGFEPPDARLGTTLCFAVPTLAGVAPGRHEACLDLIDRFDGARARVGCTPFRLEPDDEAYRALLAEVGPLVARRAEVPAEAFVADLDELRRRATDAGRPFLAMRLTLIGAYVLRRAGTPGSLDAAASRLAEPPPWIDAPPATAWAAQLAYERATLAMARGWDLQVAWRRLQEAQEAYRAVASPDRIVASLKQAEILARVGAIAEGRHRLATALAECGMAPCRETLLPAARGTLAWLIALDTDAGDDELREAESILVEALDGLRDESDPLERANAAINLAYVRQRRGVPHDDRLALARELLRETAGDSPRARDLAGWIDLVDALGALGEGRAADALELGRRIAATAAAPRLRAWGVSCQSRAHRRLGDLDAAAATMDRALVLHEYATAAALGQDIALGPGQRAADVYRAARIAVERSRPAEAWGLLADLATADARAACVENDDAGSRAERDAILDELAALEVPAAGDRRRHREAIREELMQRLRERLRSAALCARTDPGTAAADFRAFAVDDEVVVLRRVTADHVVTYRRTSIDLERVRALVGELVAALEVASDADPAAWQAATAALAPALVPAPEDLGPETTFALHGVLQSVPLAALPIGGGVLADHTLVALRPAATGPSRATRRGGAPLFVVDPGGDLAAGPELARAYRELFPDATVLTTAAATRDAVAAALPGARWLHVDAHARHDPAFPELSSLELADGVLTADRLAADVEGLELANLSACRTGSWPTTADSGRYGLAGWLVRHGVPWVVGARAPLDDTVAAEFNRRLYEELAAGAEPAAALRAAHDRVRRSHPAGRWGALLVLRGGAEDSGGQSVRLRTPPESVRCGTAVVPPGTWSAR